MLHWPGAPEQRGSGRGAGTGRKSQRRGTERFCVSGVSWGTGAGISQGSKDCGILKRH